MSRGKSWSAFEITATVADYMKMLTLELSGQKYNKSLHRRSLVKLLDGRSEAAVELKHQNISAVLRDLDCIWIPGYKPRGNYQNALAKCVENWINTHPEFDTVSKAAVELPAFLPTDFDFSHFVVQAPTQSLSNELRETVTSYRTVSVVSKRDYVAREARNVALGSAGEQLALQYEEYRLILAGQKALANRIEHVSAIKGDGLGYDILSFEVTGKERFIEVKTTAFAKETPFFASNNEVQFSREAADQYHLYRLFEFRKSPKLFSLPGKIDYHCTLDPMNYFCRLR